MQINLRKTKVRLDLSFVLVVTLMLLFCNEEIVLLSVFSSMFHECGHLLMMIKCKERIEKLTFGAFGVRIEKYAFSGISYKKEILIALGGIFFNLILAFTSAVVYILSENSTALMLSFINILIALMNSLPIGHLDMGQAVSSFLLMKTESERAREISEIISFVFCLAFTIFTVFYCIIIKVNFSLVAVSIYLLTETEFKIHGQ